MALLGLLGGCQLAFGVSTVGPDAPGPDASLRPGTLAHYAMDDLQATPCLHDDSGKGHDGTCVGGAVLLGDGQIGQGYHLDGTTRIQIATTGPLASGPMTIAGWFKFAGGPGAGMCPFNRLYGTDGFNSWQVCVNVGETDFYFQAAGAVPLAAAALAPDVWHHVAIASDGTSVRAYLDGGLVGELPIALMFDPQPIELGADLDPTGLGGGVVGAIDDVWLFDRALTAAEVIALESP